MLNIMKADLYRIIRGKGVTITSVLLFLFIGLQVAANNTGVVGIMVIENGTADPSASDILTGMTAPFRMMEVTDNLIYFVLPFIIFIGSADFSAGNVKNVLSGGVSRTTLYLSRLLLSCIFCIAVMLCNVVIPILVATILRGFGGTFDMAYLGSVLRPFLAQLWLCLGITCVGVFLVFTTKRTAAVNGAYIAFCIVPLLLLFILTQINDSLSFLFDYDIVMNIRMFANFDSASVKEIVRGLLIGAFYILAGTAGGLLLFRRSEIK